MRQSHTSLSSALYGRAATNGCYLGVLSFLIAFWDALPQMGLALVGGIALAALIGVVAGAFTAPIVGFCLQRKNPAVAMPIVYVPALIVVAMATWLADPLTAALAGFVWIWVASVIGGLCLRDYLPRFPPGMCWKCGYDVSHAAHERCPECGAEIRDAATVVRRIARAHEIVDIERTALRWIWQRNGARIASILIALELAGLLAIQVLAPRFDPADFRRVKVGMTAADVRKILGPPHEIRATTTGVGWIYTDGWPLPRAVYHIEYSDDRVASTGVDWW